MFRGALKEARVPSHGTYVVSRLHGDSRASCGWFRVQGFAQHIVGRSVQRDSLLTATASDGDHLSSQLDAVFWLSHRKCVLARSNLFIDGVSCSPPLNPYLHRKETQFGTVSFFWQEKFSSSWSREVAIQRDGASPFAEDS